MPADLADQNQARWLTGPSIISSSVNAMRTVVRSTFLAVSMALLTFHGVPAGKAQSMMDQIIVSQCSAAMNDDFVKAGKTPPDGMVAKTCNCVVQTLNQTHNLDYAKKSCTEQAKQNQ